MHERHAFNEFVPMSAKQPKDIERLVGICEKYLPEQAWWHAEDELTDRSEKFLASEMVREKLFRLTGDELPYTSTVVIDKFEEEPGRTAKRMLRIAATIVVEREGHKAMVIGDKGEKLKRIGTETRMSWKSCWTPRCSSSCGSKSARVGPMTKRVCAASGTSNFQRQWPPSGLLTSQPTCCTATTGVRPA
jgi:GTP-binding protein Era